MDKSSVFNKIYANLPIGMRNEIVTVVDDLPMTWNVIYVEVQNHTPLAIKALDKLHKLGILKDEK